MKYHSPVADGSLAGGWRGREFFLHTVLSGGKLHRFKKEVCPNCGALKRQRQLVRCLGDKAGSSVPVTARLLEIGPGRGEVEWFRQRGYIGVLTVDVRPGIAMSLMDVTRMAFRDGVFDAIVCSHVLEHVPEDMMAMKEIRRVLKPGGICVIQVPLQSDLPRTVEWGKPNRQEFDHVRAYGSDFRERLKAAGFVVACSDGELFEAGKSG